MIPPKLPLVALRPEPGCGVTVRGAAALGLEAHGFPLFEVVARDWQVPDANDFDALLVGSANAFRLGGAGLRELSALPVHAVGATTAEAARDTGLDVASVGEGGLQPLVERIAAPCRLLRLSGEERVPLDPPAGVTIAERVVYASEPRPMPDGLVWLLKSPCVVLLHSGEAARHFAGECDRLGISRAHLTLAALAPRIAEASGLGWASVHVAAQAQDAALLALAKHLCQGEPAD